ncbi:MAG: hypothetical protein LBU34_13005 [Planctomycetaceae bacterium]|nr:hypothetical protein [Planctomycetaceae bacterium]
MRGNLNPPCCGGLAYIALAGHRTSRCGVSAKRRLPLDFLLKNKNWSANTDTIAYLTVSFYNK